jgi:hypothetical protein
MGAQLDGGRLVEQPESAIAASARNPKTFLLIDYTPFSLFAIASRLRRLSLGRGAETVGKLIAPSVRRGEELAQSDLSPMH